MATKSLKVLLAIDASPFSEAAVRAVISQCSSQKAVVRVFHAVEPLESPYYPPLASPYPSSLADINKSRLEAGRKLVAQVIGKLKVAGFKATGVSVEGNARTSVVDEATKWHAELIVLGSHGRTGMSRLLLGSVSEYVVRHAACSVQVVRLRKK